MSTMASRKGINISGHYVVSINATRYAFSYMHFEFLKNKGRTERYFILFLTLNDHQTRCFNFGLRRLYRNGCK